MDIESLKELLEAYGLFAGAANDDTFTILLRENGFMDICLSPDGLVYVNCSVGNFEPRRGDNPEFILEDVRRRLYWLPVSGDETRIEITPGFLTEQEFIDFLDEHLEFLEDFDLRYSRNYRYRKVPLTGTDELDVEYTLEKIQVEESLPAKLHEKIFNCDEKHMFLSQSELVQSMINCTGMNDIQSIQMLKDMFFWEFTYQLGSYGVCCSPNCQIMIPLQQVLDELPVNWEISLDIPESLLNSIQWQAVAFRNLFKQFPAINPQNSRRLLEETRMKRTEFRAIAATHLHLSEQDTKTLLGYFFLYTDNLFLNR